MCKLFETLPNNSDLGPNSKPTKNSASYTFSRTPRANQLQHQTMVEVGSRQGHFQSGTAARRRDEVGLVEELGGLQKLAYGSVHTLIS